MAKIPNLIAKSMTNHKLAEFAEKMSIGDDQLSQLNEFRDVLIGSRGEFREKFYRFFFNIPDAKTILEHVAKVNVLHNSWDYWFDSLFRTEIDAAYLEFIWGIGKRHMELNVEQRFTSLGFYLIRQFFREIIDEKIPPDKRSIISETIDKLLDLNLFVMTAAYIETTIHCDIEVIKGVEDKIRNPVTVIGGSIMRLKRDASRPDYEKVLFDSLIEQNKKLERIMLDIKKYTQLFEEEPHWTTFPVKELISLVLEKLRKENVLENIRIDINTDPGIPLVKGDQEQIGNVLYAVILNAVEAIDTQDPYIRISTRQEKSALHNMEITIFNTGTPPKKQDIDKLFSPFYSTKVMGTGFGLPFARLAVKKNYGKIALAPAPEKGTLVTITLPLPD
jgi:signal transduction histidine kinase